MGYLLIILVTVPHSEPTFNKRNSTLQELPWSHGKKLIQGETEIYLRLIWIQNLFYVAKLEQAKAFTSIETTGYFPEIGAPRRFPCVMCDIYCIYLTQGLSLFQYTGPLCLWMLSSSIKTFLSLPAQPCLCIILICRGFSLCNKRPLNSNYARSRDIALELLAVLNWEIVTGHKLLK